MQSVTSGLFVPSQFSEGVPVTFQGQGKSQKFYASISTKTIADQFNVVKGHMDNLSNNVHAVELKVAENDKALANACWKNDANHQALNNTVNANHQVTNTVIANHEALANKVNENHQVTNTVIANHEALTNKVNENHRVTNTVIANQEALSKKVNENQEALSKKMNENHQVLTNALNQDRQKTQGSLKKTDEDFKACDKKIQLQAGQITGIQQRAVVDNGRIATLEAKAQQEKAGRDAVENRVKNIEGQVRGFNQIQADLTETKVRLALVEQQHAIRFKSLEADKKQVEALKQEVLNFFVIQQQFKRTIEENKKESKAKYANAANQINQLRERIDNGDKAIKSKADAEEVPEQDKDPILRAINQEKDDKESPELKQDEAKLSAIMAAGGPKGDIKKIEWQSQVLARLEERNKLKMESLTHQMLALKQNMQQLEKREEASRKTDKKNHSKTSLIITQLREQIQESNAKKPVKRQRSLVDLNHNKKKTED